jgi:CBS-domain-containing membrane protein
VKKRLARLPGKMKGKLRGTHSQISIKYATWGMLSGTVSILAILAVTKMAGYPLLIGSFGASAVLLFGANDSPLAHPKTDFPSLAASNCGVSGLKPVKSVNSQKPVC